MKKVLSRKITKGEKGFTLIELMVVMAIIAVLAVLIIGAITVARNTAKETAHRTNAKALQTGMESYYSKNRAYPAITAGTTFTSSATTLGVGLTTVGVCANGGGTVSSTSTGYTISPVASNCTDPLAGDVITGP